MLRKLRDAFLVCSVALLVVATAQAAPIGTLKQFKTPTANSSPKGITQGSDGNFWFTEAHVNPGPQSQNHSVGRITRAGAITEFAVCSSCFPNEIVQGPDGILYFTKSDPGLGRITTSGTVLPDVVPPNTLANGEGVAASGNSIYFAAFNTNSIWRYDTVADTFTEFPIPTPSSTPFDVAVAADGTVWFTEFGGNKIGRLDPATGTITETGPLDSSANGPRGIAIGVDGKVWFTKRFDDLVGFLDPTTNAVTTFPTAAGAGAEGIAAAPDGSAWFAQSVAGNVARITTAGALTEGKSVKGSEPFGVTVAPDGNPWYTELSADKIAQLQVR
jgi:virginiamycin B lyase